MGASKNTLAGQAAALRSRITRFRKRRGKRFPLAVEMWSEAVALAQELGTSRAAQALGVSYDALQRHVGQTDVPRREAERVDEIEFVELKGAQRVNVPAPQGTVLELVNEEGGRLTIRLGSADQLDLAGLVVAFGGWRR